jgi:hypothetical protein
VVLGGSGLNDRRCATLVGDVDCVVVHRKQNLDHGNLGDAEETRNVRCDDVRAIKRHLADFASPSVVDLHHLALGEGGHEGRVLLEEVHEGDAQRLEPVRLADFVALPDRRAREVLNPGLVVELGPRRAKLDHVRLNLLDEVRNEMLREVDLEGPHTLGERVVERDGIVVIEGRDRKHEQGLAEGDDLGVARAARGHEALEEHDQGVNARLGRRCDRGIQGVDPLLVMSVRILGLGPPHTNNRKVSKLYTSILTLSIIHSKTVI